MTDEAKNIKILKQGFNTLDRDIAKKYMYAYILSATNEKNPIDIIFDLIEANNQTAYKIKVMNRGIPGSSKEWQLKKKIYDSYKKFMSYGNDMFRCYHNTIHYNKNDTYCILYKMVNGEWVVMDAPEEFLI